MELIKSKYELGVQIGEDVLSYFYEGKIALSGRSVYIWMYKGEFLNPPLIKKLAELSEKLSYFKHPYILPLIDYYTDGKNFYTIHDAGAEVDQPHLMPLEEFLKSETPYSYNTLWKLASQVLGVLLELEAKDIPCGAINLHALYVDEHGTIIRFAKIGLPIEILKRKWQSMTVIDDCIFYPPEFIQKQEFTIQSDIYAFGMLLYVFFSHQWPYTFTTQIDKFKRALLKAPKPFKKVSPHIPEKLTPLVEGCLDKNAKKRFANFDSLISSYREGKSPTFFQDDLEETDIHEELRKSIRYSFVKKMRRTIQEGWKVGGAVLVLISVYLMYVGFLGKSPDKVVPNVVGLSSEDAKRLLEKNQFKCVISGYRTHAYMPEDYVIESRPPGGRDVKQDRLVRLYISKGQGQIQVPDFVGKKLSELKDIISDNVTYNVYEAVYSDTVPQGVVISQTPSANEVLSASESIKLVVSQGFPVRFVLLKSEKTGLKKVRVLFDVPEGWDNQKIEIEYIYQNKVTDLYSKTHTQNNKLSADFDLPLGGTLRVFYNQKQALEQVVDTPHP